MKELILFSHQFPYKIGDASFIKNEIADLAKAFDKVFLVVLENQEQKGLYELPKNVEMVFAGFTGRKDIIKKGLLNWISITTVIRLFTQDVIAIRNAKHLKHFLLACLVGRGLASNEKIRELLSRDNISLYFFWGAGAAYIIPFLNKKLFTTIKFHRGDLYLERNGGYIPFRKPILGYANYLIAISDNGGAYLRNYLESISENPEKVSVIKLGTPDFGVSPRNNTDTTTIIVSCSSLISIKRVPLIFEVMEALSKKRKVHWVHFGDGIEMPRLKKMVSEGLKEGLTVELKGQTDNSALMHYYQNNPVDLFINLSTSEGIPVSIMEAASFDIPILATDVGGTGELVGMHMQTGILVEADISIQQCVQHLINLLESKEKFKPREYWQQQHAADVNNKRLINLLRVDND